MEEFIYIKVLHYFLNCRLLSASTSAETVNTGDRALKPLLSFTLKEPSLFFQPLSCDTSIQEMPQHSLSTKRKRKKKRNLISVTETPHCSADPKDFTGPSHTHPSPPPPPTPAPPDPYQGPVKKFVPPRFIRSPSPTHIRPTTSSPSSPSSSTLLLLGEIANHSRINADNRCL